MAFLSMAYIYGRIVSEWEKKKEKVMLTLLRIKFKTGSKMTDNLKTTGTKMLAESGKDKFFTCGMPLTHPNVLDAANWRSNVLEWKLQMKIRDELNEQ